MLILPSANRVYADAAQALTRAELAAFAPALRASLGKVGERTVGGASYVTVEADHLSARDLGFLANLSALYALFRFEDGGLLRPVEVRRLDRYDDDLITIPKYAGKTNDQFTKLLLNVTVLASDFADRMLDERLRVLDPLCGRGTTLNHAMMYGWDAFGIDHDRKDIEAYSGFLRTWLKRKRIKHRADIVPVRRDRRLVGRRLTVSCAPTKEEYARGDTQTIEVTNADTTQAAELYRPGTFHVVVADAPYGVQHGSRTASKGLARSPLDLLAAGVPGWAALLRSGGAVGLAWNTNVARREDAVAILADAGLVPADLSPYVDFRHRVDQAVMRDVLVARKP